MTAGILIDPIDAKALIDAQSASDLCIVDLGSEVSYQEGHVPGAVHLPFQALMSGQPPAPGKLPPKAQLDQVFRYLGLGPETTFLVYDDEGGGWAGRFIWTLDVIGHTRYHVIDGGIHAWRQAGLETESEVNKREPIDADVTIHPAPIADVEDILPTLNDQSAVIWDARSPMEYSGQRVTAAKAGHIPGAINVEWTSLMDPARGLRVREDAKTLLAQQGIDGSKPIITHCQSHHRSGFTYLLGRHYGWPIRGYHGSWSEWGNHPDTPVEC